MLGFSNIHRLATKMLRLDKLSIRQKILLISKAGCIGLVINLMFYTWTSVNNNNVLTSIQEEYYPALEDIDSAISMVDILEPAMQLAIENIDALDGATQYVLIIEELLAAVVETSPAQAEAVETLQEQLNDYVATATSLINRVNSQPDLDIEDEIFELEDEMFEVVIAFADYRTVNYDIFIAAIDQAQTTTLLAMWITIVVASITIAVISIVGVVISNLMRDNLSSLAAFADRVAQGDLESKIDLKSKDEIGQLSDTLTEMQSDLRHRIEVERQKAEETEMAVNETVRVFSALASGDLTQTVEQEYEGAFAVLKNDANATVSKLSQVIEQDIQSIVQAALKGDLSQRIDLKGKEGFFNTLSTGVNDLVEVAERIVSDTGRLLEGMAGGDLTVRIDADYQGQFGKLKDDANATTEKLTDVVGQIRLGTQAVEEASQKISQGNRDLARRSEAQASNLEETAATMEQMTSTVRSTAENARSANELTSNACAQTEAGAEVARRAIEAMAAVSESSNKISDIINVIDGIALQTNLLALNAAVEAARAGEEGRGFAVVASEVRGLAGRSADAAREIKELIEDSIERVQESTKLVNESGQTLDEIEQSMQKVAQIVSEISDATHEQAEGIDQVNRAITEIDSVNQKNSVVVDETATISEAMREQAWKLTSLVEFFNTGDG